MSNTKNKYDVGNGIHRVPLWRIGGYALNNTATNLYLAMMMYVAYYLTGFVGMSMVLAGSFSMIMRIWDGVTDPFIGYLVDKTNTKFGKNRPFMIIGNVILLVTSYILFHVTHQLPQAARIPFFFVVSALYYIGYTFQCVVTKSAQTCVTNDPKQRPLFAIFDSIYNMVMFMAVQMWVSNTLVPKYGGLTSAELFHEMWVVLGTISAVFTIIAVIAIAPKDNIKYFGTGKAVKVGFKDYWDVLRHNRAIQMLVLSASTDKLGSQARTGVVPVILYGIVVGNYALSGAFGMYTTLGNLIFVFLGLGVIATRLGQRKAMLVGSWGGLVCNILLVFLWLFGDPKTMNLPGYEGFNGFSFFTIALLLLTIAGQGFGSVSGSIVIPMTADCADYETYRSGRYVPGLMGTLFSFVDKVVSSLAPMIASIALAMIGFRDVMPDVSTPYTDSLLYVGVFLSYGVIIFGLIVNVFAMKFYPLTKEKMEEIQSKIAEIKAQAAEA